MNEQHISPAPDVKDGLRTKHRGALDHAGRIEAGLKTLAWARKLDEHDLPDVVEQIQARHGALATLEPQVESAKTRLAVAEAQQLALEEHVGAHAAGRLRHRAEIALLALMAAGETMLAYPAFKEAVPSAAGGISDPVFGFVVGHGALLAAVAVGVASAWLQRAIGMELAPALRSVLREHRDPALEAS